MFCGTPGLNDLTHTPFVSWTWNNLVLTTNTNVQTFQVSWWPSALKCPKAPKKRFRKLRHHLRKSSCWSSFPQAHVVLVGGWALPLWKIKLHGSMTFPIYGQIIQSCSTPPISFGIRYIWAISWSNNLLTIWSVFRTRTNHQSTIMCQLYPDIFVRKIPYLVNFQ